MSIVKNELQVDVLMNANYPTTSALYEQPVN